MARLRRILHWILVGLVIALGVMSAKVPDAGPAKGFDLRSGWDLAWLLVVIAFVAAWICSVFLRRIHRRELEGTTWPATPIADCDGAGAPFDEIEIDFEDSTQSWVFSADGRTIGAFRQIQGVLGEAINVLGENFDIAPPRSRSGGLLERNGETVAVGLRSAFTGRIKITTGRKTYHLREKSLTVFRTTFVLTDGESLRARIQRRVGGWKISGVKNVDAFVVVFAYWLIIRTRAD